MGLCSSRGFRAHAATEDRRTTMFRFCVPFFELIVLSAAAAHGQTIGVNVLLNRAPSDSVLTVIRQHGTVLDVIPELNALTLRARASELPAIRSLPCVAGANPDVAFSPAGGDPLPARDFGDGASLWNLDTINVAEVGTNPCRTVEYDGEGVFIAVIDSGLPHNWREYFPEERIDALHARSFCGGGGNRGAVSSQPGTWERDTLGHGCAVTSIILGFRCAESLPGLPGSFNGVAPKATVIPIKTFGEPNFNWSSV